MAQVIPARVTAEVEGDFVVFLIGIRINKPWKIHQWGRYFWRCRGCSASSPPIPNAAVSATSPPSPPASPQGHLVSIRVNPSHP